MEKRCEEGIKERIRRNEGWRERGGSEDEESEKVGSDFFF